MSSHGVCKKKVHKDLRKAFLRDERAAEEVFKELSLDSTRIWESQSQAEAVAQATSEEAVYSKRRVQEKVGHDAKCPGRSVG